MSALAHPWDLDPDVTFLNHGSFGATPRAVLDAQHKLRAEMERQPVRFFTRALEPLLDAARARVAGFLGAAPEDLVFVRNATEGVNAALAALELAPGDEVLTLDHAYNACANALAEHARRRGARVVTASLRFPLDAPGEVLEALASRATSRTRALLLDHVTSPTALVLPAGEIARHFEARGVTVIVDGAHAPGMIPLDLARLGASYYTGNLHKWVCAPKTAGFLWARRELHAGLRPLAISHGANSPRLDRPRLHLEFDWPGTFDPTAILAAPEAIALLGALSPGGWDGLRAANRARCLEGRAALCEALGVAPPCPDAMIGSMASVPIALDAARAEALHDALLDRHRVEVPVIPWSSPRGVFVRISAQAYNAPEDYARLIDALRAEGISGQGRG
ncbi:MAG: aminotransferase class V-fold PLP-dependent enzyme [Polyangiales bacterium]